MTVVYVDILFLINFSLDYMTMYLTGKWMHLAMKRARLILVSFLLALYGLWALLFCASYYILILTSVLSSSAACAFLFKTKRLKKLISCVLLFHLISISLGTLCGFLFKLIETNIANTEDYSSADKKIVVFTVLAIISGILVYIGNQLLSSTKYERELEAVIHLERYSFRLRLLVDTGNRVIDPISGRAVVFVSEAVLNHALGPHWKDDDFLMTRKRCICVETVAGKRVLPAFIVDNITINRLEQTCLLAVNQYTNFDGYDGIIPALLLGD